jgi:metal-responsive CopG/Arc/MetJ family transcriptional regulator
MKVKTSVTLPYDLVSEIDRLAGRNRSRSQFIEEALRLAIRTIKRERQNARDRDLLDKHAESLAREALDVLDYQTPL